MFQFLVIQTAFIGDVVLATAVVEKLHAYYPDSNIDFLLRKGNEILLESNPHIRKVLIWDKKSGKMKNLLKMTSLVRKNHYTHVINLHRFASSGFITCFSGASNKIGFDKNPFSFCYTTKIKHIISAATDSAIIHEIQRNQSLIASFTDEIAAKPKLYPSKKDFDSVSKYTTTPYICISPASVWFTKQFPVQKWVELIKDIDNKYTVYLLGGKSDQDLTLSIINMAGHSRIKSLAGQLSFLESAALMSKAVMNYANDSAPLHFASAVNAPVTAVFCSTIPQFGFGPVNDNGKVVEIKEKLSCRPCGLHGKKACPEGHFRCAMDITNEQLLWWT